MIGRWYGAVLATALACCAACASNGGGDGTPPVGSSGPTAITHGFDPCKVELDALSKAVGTSVERGPSHGTQSYDGIEERTCQFQAPDDDKIGFLEIGSYVGPRSQVATTVRRYCQDSAEVDSLPAGSFTCMQDPFTSVFVAAPNPFAVVVGAGDTSFVSLELRIAKVLLGRR